MNGVTRSLCTFEDIRNQEYGVSDLLIHILYCIDFFLLLIIYLYFNYK